VGRAPRRRRGSALMFNERESLSAKFVTRRLIIRSRPTTANDLKVHNLGLTAKRIAKYFNN